MRIFVYSILVVMLLATMTTFAGSERANFSGV
jgi:hypothetical protein